MRKQHSQCEHYRSMDWGLGLYKKEKAREVPHIHLSLLPDFEYNVAGSLISLPAIPSSHDRLQPQTVSQNKPFLYISSAWNLSLRQRK